MRTGSRPATLPAWLRRPWSYWLCSRLLGWFETSAETVAAKEHFLHVDPMPDIFQRFRGYVREAVEGVLGRAQLGLDDMLTVDVEAKAVSSLVRELISAGALDATDAVTNEIQVTTVTLMRGGGKATG